MYSLLRPLLFLLPAEWAHAVSLHGLQFAQQLGLTKSLKPKSAKPVKMMGLEFGNEVGLAAGLDKNADYIDSLADLGFGFIEVGTVTPRAQPGNPKPRLFRLTQHQALINRMGFNNNGVDYLIKKIKKSKYKGVLGINIGKNFDTPIKKAVDDYLLCLQKVYFYADYIVINVSSPNTPDLRRLQFGDALKNMLTTLKEKQQLLNKQYAKYVPLVLKVAPDLTEEEVASISECMLATKMDGLIATNTSAQRIGVESHRLASEQGGLSGAPLTEYSVKIIEQFHRALGDQIPIIGVGGINSQYDAKAKLAAGAKLVQVYTGLIYQGPGLVKEIVEALTHNT